MPRTILDVSRWQGNIDWDAVKRSGLISGVMIRAMGNSSVSMFCSTSMPPSSGSPTIRPLRSNT